MSASTTQKPDVKRRKFTPRPPRSTEERLPRLYRGLTDQVDDGHLGNAIKTCKKILSLDHKSTVAFQTLLFLYLQTDDYTSALGVVTSKKDESLAFEEAYCRYRLHQEKEALALLEKMESKGRKEQHLEAQIRYRLGEYENAQRIYDDLLNGCDASSPEHDDIATNLEATSSHIDFHKHSYHSYLRQPPPVSSVNPHPSHIPTEGELESYVPSLPAGWAKGGAETSKKPVVAPVQAKTEEKKDAGKKKRRHPLPKGATEGKSFSEDPDRWLPMRQRASYLAAQSKKKGNMLSMGTGITQGSTASQQASSGGGGGGGKKKKGKK